MKRFFADTLLTRSILIVVAALILAQVIAIVSFKLIAENVFFAMQRQAQLETAVGVLKLAQTQDSAGDFALAAADHANVLFVRRDSYAPAPDGDEMEAEIRRKLGGELAVSDKISRFQVNARLAGPASGEGPRNRGGAPGMGEGDKRPPPPEGGSLNDRPPKPDGMLLRTREGPGPGRGDRPVIRFDRFEGDMRFPPRVVMVSVEFGEGDWVNVLASSGADHGPPIQPFIFVLSLSMLAVAVAAGLAARWIYRPLNDLGRAAKSLGSGEKHMPLPVSGPRDIRNVMTAFNTMATRLEATLQSQKDVLVAIGHDLRTPLTAMRIRAAMIEDVSEREKMERALDELQSLTEAALQAGTTSLRTDEKLVTDLGALVESLCEDLGDIGMPVSVEESEERLLVEAWPEDLTRALRNIMVNAVRYGERARIRLEKQGDQVAVIIDDDGPGIPQDQLDAVFEPLVRLEKSRNTETGGHGLGLHIARNIVLAHGGLIELSNRTEGGFRATVFLPRKTT